MYMHWGQNILCPEEVVLGKKKTCQKSHRFELRSCSTQESKELWSRKTCIQMQMLSPSSPKHVHLTPSEPTIQQSI